MWFMYTVFLWLLSAHIKKFKYNCFKTVTVMQWTSLDVPGNAMNHKERCVRHHPDGVQALCLILAALSVTQVNVEWLFSAIMLPTTDGPAIPLQAWNDRGHAAAPDQLEIETKTSRENMNLSLMNERSMKEARHPNWGVSSCFQILWLG